jgi:hypothetical protein
MTDTPADSLLGELNPRNFRAGLTPIGKLLKKTREDGRYTMAMYDCEMAALALIAAHEQALLDSLLEYEEIFVTDAHTGHAGIPTSVIQAKRKELS